MREEPRHVTGQDDVAERRALLVVNAKSRSGRGSARYTRRANRWAAPTPGPGALVTTAA